MEKRFNPITHDIYEGKLFFSKKGGEKGFMIVQEGKHKIEGSYKESILHIKPLVVGFDYSQEEVEKWLGLFKEEKDLKEFSKASFDIINDDGFHNLYYDGYRSYFFQYANCYFYAAEWGRILSYDIEFAFYQVGSKESALMFSKEIEEDSSFEKVMKRIMTKGFKPIIRVDTYQPEEYTYFLSGDLAKRHMNFVLEKYMEGWVLGD